jgi:cold shock CspA family protein
MTDRVHGTVVLWQPSTGFGLVKPDGDDVQLVQVTWRGLLVADRSTLLVGDRVAFTPFQRAEHALLEARDVRHITSDADLRVVTHG